MSQSHTKAERKYDLYTQKAKWEAYDTYKVMRQDDPIHKQISMDGNGHIWWVTRYEDVDRILRDNKTFVRDWRLLFPPDPDGSVDETWRLLEDHMLNKDGVDHRRLRNLVSKAFTPRIISGLRLRIEEIANELIDDVEQAGQMDLVTQYAYQLPTIVISELLGIPVEDRDKFKAWTSAVFTPTFDEESGLQAMALIQEFAAYLGALFANRRQNPQDDFVTKLIFAEENGDNLTESELYSMMFLLIVAGHETTVNLIGNAMKALWNHPEQLKQLKRHPEMIETAVEEFLRYDGSVERALVRWAIEDVVVSGVTIPRGSAVIVVLGSANHDETVIENAAAFDISRKPTPHLAFGKGAHYCLGAPLARLETAVAINTLLARLPDIHPTVPLKSLRWRNMPGFRGLERLPVAWRQKGVLSSTSPKR